MIDVYVIYNDPETRKRIEDTVLNKEIFIHFLDEGSFKDKKEAFKIKSHWGARMSPFCCIIDKDKSVKGFWSETGSNIINDLISYLNEKTE